MSGFKSSQAIHALGEEFFDPVQPANFNPVGIRFVNANLAEEIGLKLSEADTLKHFLRFEPIDNSLSEPLALRYHGHQFRQYNPEIGDGRGFLFAQFEHEGRLLDFGTKGSGTTPYSRQGDGRLTLLGGVREVLASEYLNALGVNTSRAFTLIETDEALTRHDEPSPTRAAVLTRLSHSHIRFGTFQRQAFFGKTENLEALVKYCQIHFYPGAETTSAFFEQVVKQSADTIAAWMVAGFVHGVMNTDNMNITGESFDYGPYRFLPTLEPGYVAAYFDHGGLYAFGRQPDAMIWNLAQLAQCLSLITEDQPLIDALDQFSDHYQSAINARLIRRLGVKARPNQDPSEFVKQTFTLLKDSQTPWPEFWHDWRGGADRASGKQSGDYKGAAWKEWQKALAEFEGAAERPQTDRPVSLLYDEIGALWKPIAAHDDWSLFKQKLSDIALAV